MLEQILPILEQRDDGTIIRDPLNINVQDFKWQKGYKTHKLSQTEAERFWTIPEFYLGSQEYEDILLLMNNILDPFELKAGVEIFIPNFDELQEFINKQKTTGITIT